MIALSSRRIGVAPVVALAVSLLGAGMATANPALIGGFRPVAAEKSARAVWTNPAAVGITGSGSAAAEIAFRDDDPLALLGDGGSDDWELPSNPLGLSVAAATDRLAYGWQYEFDDAPGVPDWTFAVGNGVPMGQGGRIGATLEWRGGDDGGVEGTVGSLFRLGRSLHAAAVVQNLLERRTDGVDVPRSLQLGAALDVEAALGHLTWDTVFPGDGADAVHWIGFAIDEAKHAHLSFARSTDGDWSATLDLVFPHHLFGIGAFDRDATEGGPQRAFLAAEWRGRQLPGTASPTGR